MTGKLILVACLAVAGSCVAEEVSLSKDIMPVFERSCASCHKRIDGNEKAVKNEVFFEKKEDVVGAIGTFIIPGKPEESGLLKVLDQTKKFGRRNMPMPPPRAENPKWSDEELKKFSDWVKAGAKDN